MNEDLEENGQFKMRAGDTDEPIDESVIPTTVDELRLEKLNTRVTVISILIPVLIVIVLVIAYLDIKKRVVHTEDTGSINVQKLSQDLESRFSSLSVRQAELEQNLTALVQKSDQAAARMEVKLKKMED